MQVKPKHSYFILVLILIISAFLRFYRLPEMANYDFDQEYASNFAYSVLREYPIQLIGQGLSVQGLFMGPLYFYYLVPFFALTNLHPIGGYIGSVFLGLFTIFIYYWVFKKVFNTETGLIAAFFRGILYSFIETDWTLTPAFSSDLMVVLTMYFLYRYWHGTLKYLVPLFFCFGLYTSFHPILFPFYLVFLVVFFFKRNIPNLKILFASIIAFIIPLTPLIIFEYLHSFLEVKLLFSFFSTNTSSSSTIEKDYIFLILKYINIIFKEPHRIFGLNIISQSVFSSVLFFVVLFSAIKKVNFWKDNFHIFFFLSTFISFILYYLIFPAHVTEYYFLAIFIVIIIYSIATLSVLIHKTPLVLFLILAITAFLNFKHVINKWNYPALITLAHKDFIVKEIVKRQHQGEAFFVSYIKEPGWNFGFNYLFKLYERIPQTTEVKPPIYTIVIPKSLSEGPNRITSGNIHLILPQSK